MFQGNDNQKVVLEFKYFKKKNSKRATKVMKISSTVGELNDKDALEENIGGAEVSFHNDFLTVGSMGHSSSIALGVAISNKSKKIVCLDGDGSAIMHLGSQAIISAQNPSNFVHIILNNGAHDSVGGQPTVGKNISLTSIAKACNYKEVFKVKSKSEKMKNGAKRKKHTQQSKTYNFE